MAVLLPAHWQTLVVLLGAWWCGAEVVTDPAVTEMVRGQVRTERGGQVWPGFDEEAIFELSIKNCLLMLTRDGEAFPAGPTIWKAGRLKAEQRNAADGRRSDRVT